MGRGALVVAGRAARAGRRRARRATAARRGAARRALPHRVSNLRIHFTLASYQMTMITDEYSKLTLAERYDFQPCTDFETILNKTKFP